MCVYANVLIPAITQCRSHKMKACVSCAPRRRSLVSAIGSRSVHHYTLLQQSACHMSCWCVHERQKTVRIHSECQQLFGPDQGDARAFGLMGLGAGLAGDGPLWKSLLGSECVCARAWINTCACLCLCLHLFLCLSVCWCVSMWV